MVASPAPPALKGLVYTHVRAGTLQNRRTIPPPPPTAAQQLAGLGGATSHEIEAAHSGRVASCCDGGNEKRV